MRISYQHHVTVPGVVPHTVPHIETSPEERFAMCENVPLRTFWEAEWTEMAEIKKAEFLAVGEAWKAIII